jgi:hypothetical protein
MQSRLRPYHGPRGRGGPLVVALPSVRPCLLQRRPTTDDQPRLRRADASVATTQSAGQLGLRALRRLDVVWEDGRQVITDGVFVVLVVESVLEPVGGRAQALDDDVLVEQQADRLGDPSRVFGRPLRDLVVGVPKPTGESLVERHR